MRGAGICLRGSLRGGETGRAPGSRRAGGAASRSAASLRDQFDKQFWCDEIGTYALALDGDKRPCKVRASNAGQCLFTGIAAPQRARQVADQLLSETFFTGWGVRTVATSEARYNPMSYHNGSVWPHDTALIALGFSRYGLRDAAAQLLTGLFDASSFVDLGRLPELFCGFPRRPGEGPTRYPVACAPQTWASASVFLLLQALSRAHSGGAGVPRAVQLADPAGRDRRSPDSQPRRRTRAGRPHLSAVRP